MYISLNELSQRVTIIRPSTVVDGAGNIIENGQEEICTVWAKIIPYASKISNGYAEKVDEVNYRIVIRYRQDIEVTDIIRWRSHRFLQTAPAYDFRCNRQYLVMEVRELIEDGQERI